MPLLSAHKLTAPPHLAAMRDVPSEVVVVEPGRTLVFWDLVECVHQGTIKERYVFLCSDVIYIAKPSLKDKVCKAIQNTAVAFYIVF